MFFYPIPDVGTKYICQSTNFAITIDVSSFDTSNVTNMHGMFADSQATSLDVSFEISKVTNMRKMFYESQVTSLDLSSFDTLNITDIDDMFTNSKVKSITARTKTDADKYKASSEFSYYDIIMKTKP